MIVGQGTVPVAIIAVGFEVAPDLGQEGTHPEHVGVPDSPLLSWNDFRQPVDGSLGLDQIAFGATRGQRLHERIGTGCTAVIVTGVEHFVQRFSTEKYRAAVVALRRQSASR